MVVSLKANKKRIIAFVLLAAVVVGACLLLRGGSDKEKKEINGGTNEERIAYLQTFGWELDTEPAETREVMIPAQFNDVYTAYNVMQKAQGFDLKPFAGEVCTQYKYKVNNYPNNTEVFATLLVYGNLIVGGDVACAEVDGFMHGFAADSARYGESSTGSASSAPEKGAVSSMSESSMASSMPESSAVQSSAVAGDADAESTAADPEDGENVEDTDTGDGEDVDSTAGEPVPEDAFPTD